MALLKLERIMISYLKEMNEIEVKHSDISNIFNF